MKRLLHMVFRMSAALSMDFTAPTVPESGQYIFPEEPESFGEGVLKILRSAVDLVEPALAGAAGVCLCLIAVVLLVCVFRTLPGGTGKIIELVSTLSVAALLLKPSNALIQLGAQTVTQLSEYGKLLLPVMTAALAAQGSGETYDRARLMRTRIRTHM